MLNSSEIPQTHLCIDTYDKTQFLLPRVDVATNKKGISPLNVYFTIGVIVGIFVA